MAIGLALLLGFKFPANFDAPYSATSLQDFWRRWHMTLWRWLRDYVYVPLGGSRGGRRRTYRNLMLTMLLGGLWHGAGWTFVAWGALHGGGLVYERWRSDRRTMRPFPDDASFAEGPPGSPRRPDHDAPVEGNGAAVAVAVDPRLAAEPHYAIQGAAPG